MSQEQFLRIALIQDMRAFLTHAREDTHVHARLFLQLNQITILLSCIFVLSSSIHLLNRCVVLRVVSCLGCAIILGKNTFDYEGCRQKNAISKPRTGQHICCPMLSLLAGNDFFNQFLQFMSVKAHDLFKTNILINPLTNYQLLNAHSTQTLVRIGTCT